MVVEGVTVSKLKSIFKDIVITHELYIEYYIFVNESQIVRHKLDLTRVKLD